MSRFKKIRNFFLYLSWVPVAVTFNNHVYKIYQIRGFSMSQTLNPGLENTKNDLVLVQKFGLKKKTSLSRGNIVLLRSPIEPESIIAKRIIGMEGDEIKTRYNLYIKDVEKISSNHLWVEGDNQAHSIDSNFFGPVSRGLVIGKVVMVIWPFNRFGCCISKGGRSQNEVIINNET